MEFESNYEECIKCNHRRHISLFKDGNLTCNPCIDYKKEEVPSEE